VALAAVCHNLANYPLLQEELREEAVQLLKNEGKFDYNVVNELPLMTAFINETLRFYPPGVRATTRVSLTDYPYGKVTLPKGAGIHVGVYQLHENPDFWPEPEKFDPTRFLGDNKSLIDPISWQPFGAGLRYCIGINFAFLEMKLFLANLLLEFRIESGPNTERGLLSMEQKLLTEAPSKGVHVRLVPCSGPDSEHFIPPETEGRTF
jgi:cytochrome P450